MILDSTYLGDLADQKPAALELAGDLDAQPVPKRVPTAVIWEVFTGVGNTFPGHADRLRIIYERLLADRSTVGLTPSVARQAGELNGEHTRSDTLADLDDVDSIVAAHGLALDEPVIADDGDFQDVDGLDVVTYR